VLNNIGSILAARGDSRAALDAHRQSATVLEAVPAGARDLAWRLMLARVQVATGDAVWELGDIPGAERHYAVALATARQGHALFANDVWIERQIGVVEQRLGDAAAAQSNWQVARTHNRASLAVDEALLSRDPDSLELQRDLGTDWSRVGAVAFMLGQHKEALAAHEQALALRTRLALADPTDARAQDDAAESHLHRAQSLASMGRVNDARDAASLATDGWRKLVQQDPDNARLCSSLANALAALARCEAVAGQHAAALSGIAEARGIRVRLARDHPDFKAPPQALARLDELEAAIRAGRKPSTAVFVDAWTE
jgi:tetratricopeptide (TPR) repeat protein